MQEAAFFGNRTAPDPSRLDADKTTVLPLDTVRYMDSSSSEWEEVGIFAHQSMYCNIDSGHLIVAEYRENLQEPDAIENKLLDSPLESDKDDLLFPILSKFVPTIFPFHIPATRITVQTVEGCIVLTVDDKPYYHFDYPLIPAHLSHLPKASVLDLDRHIGLWPFVDCVRWNEQFFAFKQIAENPIEIMQEISTIDRLRDCPFIISLSAIVVQNYVGEKRIRGFLTPFLRAGTLRDVFTRARSIIGDNEDAVIDWHIKLGWALQITQGVVALHAILAFNGDLKPENILIDHDGIVKLIDFTSLGCSHMWAPPEYRAAWNDRDAHIEWVDMLSAAADVYSLGRLLWAVAEERWEIRQSDTSRVQIHRSSMFMHCSR